MKNIQVTLYEDSSKADDHMEYRYCAVIVPTDTENLAVPAVCDFSRIIDLGMRKYPALSQAMEDLSTQFPTMFNKMNITIEVQ